jgi:hypothetical protein
VEQEFVCARSHVACRGTRILVGTGRKGAAINRRRNLDGRAAILVVVADQEEQRGEFEQQPFRLSSSVRGLGDELSSSDTHAASSFSPAPIHPLAVSRQARVPQCYDPVRCWRVPPAGCSLQARRSSVSRRILIVRAVHGAIYSIGRGVPLSCSSA